MTDQPPSYETRDSRLDEGVHSSHTSTFQFTKLLSECNRDKEFSTSPYYQGSDPFIREPTTVELVAHLKFLKAIGELKRKICYGLLADQEELLWKAFVSNAVRRFILFISALKAGDDNSKKTVSVNYNESRANFNKIPKSPKLAATLFGLLPPLDILMVWHSFLLNPKSAYDNFARNGFLAFLFHPFPFEQIDRSISNLDYSFRPNETLQFNFHQVMNSYGCDMNYDFNGPFNPEELVLDIHCPVCEAKIAETCLSSIDNHGFADGEFTSEKLPESACNCHFSNTITHEDLRKRELFADLNNEYVLPNIYKFKSCFMNNKNDLISEVAISNKVFKNMPINLTLNVLPSNETVSLRDVIASLSKVKHDKMKPEAVFREYMSMNLLHLTIPRIDSLKITEDLVGCVIRQGRFVTKMNEINWLESPWVEQSLVRAKDRYKKYWELLNLSRTMLVPTLDIDLMWHTHQLSFHFYHNHCTAYGLSFIDHNDKLDASLLDNMFEKTAKLYRSINKEEYSTCPCWYCMAIRDKSRPTIKKLFRKNSKGSTQEYDLMYDDDFQSHASFHNAIFFPSKAAEMGRNKMNFKYEQIRKPLPFNDILLANDTRTSYLYVVPPLVPIPVAGAVFYGNGLCGGSGGCSVGSGTTTLGCAPGMCGSCGTQVNTYS